MAPVPDPKKALLKDRVLAIVRAASPELVGTSEIGDALGPRVCEWMEWVYGGKQVMRRVHYSRHPASSFHHVLRSLERAGCVERVKTPRAAGVNPQGQDYWRFLSEVSRPVAPPPRRVPRAERRAAAAERQRRVEELLGG